MVTALILSFVTAMVVTSAVLYTGSARLNARAKGNSETALLLADAGINVELKKVTDAVQQYNGSTAWDTPTSKGSGSVAGVTGTYSVWVSSSADGTGTWSGSGKFYITCTATTVGASRKVVIQGSAYSIFDLFGIFAYNSDLSGSNSALKLTGNAVVTVDGNVGTNGVVSSGNGTLTILSGSAGYNYNTDFVGTNHPQLTSANGTIYSFNFFKTFPTVPSLAQAAYNSGFAAWQGQSGNQSKTIWDYMNSNFASSSAPQGVGAGLNSAESARIYTWSSTATSTTPLSSTSVSLAFPTANKPPGTTLDNSGLWTKSGAVVNNDPTTGKKCLILQPGDYYFSNVDLTDSTKELIIDNGGVTVTGAKNGNPDKIPVRIWIGRNSSGGNADAISIPISLTNSSDRSTFRVFYATDKQTLKFTASNATGYNTNGSTYQVAGAFYSISGGNTGTTITFEGVGQSCNFVGALIADQVNFNGNCNIVWDPGIGNSTDAYGGVAVLWTGDYALP